MMINLYILYIYILFLVCFCNCLLEKKYLLLIDKVSVNLTVFFKILKNMNLFHSKEINFVYNRCITHRQNMIHLYNLQYILIDVKSD